MLKAVITFDSTLFYIKYKYYYSVSTNLNLSCHFASSPPQVGSSPNPFCLYIFSPIYTSFFLICHYSGRTTSISTQSWPHPHTQAPVIHLYYLSANYISLTHFLLLSSPTQPYSIASLHTPPPPTILPHSTPST